MTPATVAELLAGAAVWLVSNTGAAAATRLRRLHPTAATRAFSVAMSWPEPRRAAVLSGTAAAMLSGFLVGPAAIVPSGLGVGEFVRRLVLARRQRAADVLRSEVARWCAAVASELRIGRTPGAAIDAATEEIDAASSVVFAPIAAVAAMSGDVSASLRSAADRPGASALRHVAACWAVAGDAGAGLAAALQRLAAALQATQRLRGEVTAQLAGARASARLLAMLPLFGLLLGHAIGAQPMHFLLHTTAGAVCAALTVVLDVIGLAWTDHIAARVAVP